MAAPVVDQVCITSGCSKAASLQCPTCLKMNIQGSFFCSQVSKKVKKKLRTSVLYASSFCRVCHVILKDCFKGFWKDHKIVHKKKSSVKPSPSNYNPWPGFRFTGKLRPYPLVRKFNIKTSSSNLINYYCLFSPRLRRGRCLPTSSGQTTLRVG